MLQISGSLTYDRSHQRRAGQPDLEHPDRRRPVVAGTTYRVTVNNFLADGGDSYSTFTQGTNRFVGEIDLDAFARYIELLGTVIPVRRTGSLGSVTGSCQPRRRGGRRRSPISRRE